MELSQGIGCQMMSFFGLFIPKTKVKLCITMKKTKLTNFLGLVKNGIFIFTKKKHPKTKIKTASMTLYILTVRVISSYSVHESTILFQWFILLKTLKHVISSSETKTKKKPKICYRTTEPLWKIIITNMQS